MGRIVDLLGVNISLIYPSSSLSPTEHSFTFLGNALLKARAYLNQTPDLILGDDAGLSLAQFPDLLGLQTADFFTQPYGKRDFLAGVARLQKLCGRTQGIAASLHCALALISSDGSEITAIVQVDGELDLRAPDLVLELDSIFIPQGCKDTLNRLPVDQQKLYWPRYIAFKKLMKELQYGHL